MIDNVESSADFDRKRKEEIQAIWKNISDKAIKSNENEDDNPEFHHTWSGSTNASSTTTSSVGKS